ncbi:MAG: transcription antitermination factor NusB [Alicyclobacillus sp.]|nr:transcription antitermination factor NusB [Alicyclobacillus sp.]
MKRHELRAKAVQALYQMEVGKAAASAAVAHVLEGETEITPHERAYVERLVNGAAAAQTEIDELLSERMQGWSLTRLARVDLSVLRLAVYELLYEPAVDLAVVIDEAVELAKEYSTEESGRFVNGVLARVLPVAQARREAAQP